MRNPVTSSAKVFTAARRVVICGGGTFSLFAAVARVSVSF